MEEILQNLIFSYEKVAMSCQCEIRDKIIEAAIDFIQEELNECGDYPCVEAIIYGVTQSLYASGDMTFDAWSEYFNEDDVIGRGSLQTAIKYALFICHIRALIPDPKPLPAKSQSSKSR